jgi:hypothetical protein
MEPKFSLMCSKELNTGPYPKPDKSGPHSPIIDWVPVNTVRSNIWVKMDSFEFVTDAWLQYCDETGIN